MKENQDRHDEVMVSVLCTAYRHEPYLRQCLDGIVSQQAGFRFEAIVHDDASPDGCSSIIEDYARRYPDIIRPIYQTENQYSKTHDLYRTILFPAARGKYVAICEGDDYWTDPHKLQKQVDLLEKEPECGLVYTAFQRYDQTTGQVDTPRFRAYEGHVYDELLSARFHIGTLTAVFRKSLLDTLPPLDARKYFCGDAYWFYHIAYHSVVRAVPEVTCVYRLLPQSGCHFTDCRRRIAFLYARGLTRKYYVTHCPPARKAVARKVLKKAQVDLVKQALATADYALMRDARPAFFPILTGKKLGYTLLAYWVSGHPRRFARLAERYARHLDAKERRR